MSSTIVKTFTEWCQDQGTIDSSNKIFKLVDLISLLKRKGYSESAIMDFGPEICQKLSDSSLPEALRNCQELTVAYEVKNVIDMLSKEVETVERTVEPEKTVVDEIIETDEELSIDMDIAELELEIETDTSYLDSIKETK